MYVETITRNNNDLRNIPDESDKNKASSDRTYCVPIHPERFQCDICWEEFTKKSILDEHIVFKHTKLVKTYKCRKCTYQTTNKRYLKPHLNKHKNPDVKSYQSYVCVKRSAHQSNIANLEKHNNSLDKIEDMYKCSQCSFVSKYKSIYREHILRNNCMLKPFQCDICLSRFSLNRKLRCHVKSKHGRPNNENIRKCPYCSYETKSESELEKHVRKHNESKQFECQICNKKLRTEMSLKCHIKYLHLHDDVNDFRCAQCPFQTKYKRSFLRHLNIHKI